MRIFSKNMFRSCMKKRIINLIIILNIIQFHYTISSPVWQGIKKDCHQKVTVLLTSFFSEGIWLICQARSPSRSALLPFP